MECEMIGRWLDWMKDWLEARRLKKRFEKVKRKQLELGMPRVYMFDPFGASERVELLFTLAHTPIDYFDYALIYRVRRLLTS